MDFCDVTIKIGFYDLVDIFGMEFLKKFDLEESRNYKLNGILN